MREPHPMSQPWYCCGNDDKCAGGCDCQCHALAQKLKITEEALHAANLLAGAVEAAMVPQNIHEFGVSLQVIEACCKNYRNASAPLTEPPAAP